VRRHVDLLVLDSLRIDDDAVTHIGMESALKIAREVKATMTLLVGMAHSFGDHDAVNRGLRERSDLDGLDVQLAYDGLCLRMRL